MGDQPCSTAEEKDKERPSRLQRHDRNGPQIEKRSNSEGQMTLERVKVSTVGHLYPISDVSTSSTTHPVVRRTGFRVAQRDRAIGYSKTCISFKVSSRILTPSIAKGSEQVKDSGTS
jgi:hypothetical protein